MQLRFLKCLACRLHTLAHFLPHPPQVAGYVKSAGPAGVFVCLARNLDARIRWVCGTCLAGACLHRGAGWRVCGGQSTAAGSGDVTAAPPLLKQSASTDALMHRAIVRRWHGDEFTPHTVHAPRAAVCRLGQLADGFVEQPADAFPEGSLVVGQVLSTEGGK